MISRPILFALLAPALVFPLAQLRAQAAAASVYKFQFGTAPVAPGFTAVPTATLYTASRGFGFESGATVVDVPAGAGGAAAHGAVTASAPFAFSVKVPEGNYRVTVTLGDPGADSVTTVKAETRRLMLERIHAARGEVVRRTFTVNVRGPKISTGGEVALDSREMNPTTHEAAALHWDDKLTLTFSDSHPALEALEIQKVDDAITLYIVGDSTVTDQGGWPGSSWGQMIPRWFQPEVAVANHAESGETLKGFLKERRWEKVLDSMKPGDFVLIEFGTNDSKSSGPQNIYPNQDFAETYSPADTVYKELLRRFVGDVRERHGFPIIASPSARREEVKDNTSLRAYATAAMDVAKEMNIPGIDLNAMGVALNRALGADGVKQFNDRTHHVEYGSYLQAKCIVLGLQQDHVPLAKYITTDFQFDPAHPTPLPADFDLPPDAHAPRGARGRGPGAAAGSTPAGTPPASPN